MKPDVLYEDEAIIIVNKSSGLLVLPDRFDTQLPYLRKALELYLGTPVYVVHRIDRDTSGAIVFAKNVDTHKYLSELFSGREVNKYYTGLVNGRVYPEEGHIDAAIAEHPTIKGKMTVAKKGKASATDYKVVEQWPLYSLVNFRIYTGRTHQIRVHMQSIGHSLVCDELYGDGKPFYLSGIKKKYRLSDNEEMERPLLSRLALHAARIEFTDEKGKEIIADAPLPKDMTACVSQLNKWCRG